MRPGWAAAMGGQGGGPRLDRPGYLHMSFGCGHVGGGAERGRLSLKLSEYGVRILPKKLGGPRPWTQLPHPTNLYARVVATVKNETGKSKAKSCRAKFAVGSILRLACVVEGPLRLTLKTPSVVSDARV